jgi:hypothetical protein
MKFRDPQKEAEVQERRTQALENKKTQAMDIMKKTFNVINHQGPPRKVDLLPRTTKEMVATRSYHVLTNLPHGAHDRAPTLYDEDYSLTQFLPPTNRSRARTSTGGREFNIVSNEYYDNPQERKQQEYEKLKSHVLKKYWETHDYDAVKGVYYSQEREKIYQTQKQVIAEVQGKSQEARLPPSIAYSDGNSYDIIKHEVYDDSRLKANMTMEQRSLNRVKKREKEAEHKEKGERGHLEQEIQRINRIKFNRWQTEIDRGFDPIKNEVNLDRPTPLPPRPATMWARLTSNSIAGEEHHQATSAADTLGFNEAKTRYRDKFPSLFSDTSPGNGTISNNNNLQDSQAFNQLDQYIGFDQNITNRARNLSGGGQRTNNSTTNKVNNIETGRSTSREPVSVISQLTSARQNIYPTPALPQKTHSAKAIPSLDVTKVDYGEPVTYKVPDKAPPGFSIPMVRTGGFSAH